jgi:hypothetical protein
MSKRVGAHIKCPSCGTETEFYLYRSLWIEDPENRKMVFEDRVNLFECPSCGRTERAQFPFLCTNKELGLAVWYEPYHDEAIDRDVEGYKQQMGPNSFYATAPRISDWEDFKKKIIEIENTCEDVDIGIEISDESAATIKGFMDHISAEVKSTKSKPEEETKIAEGNPINMVEDWQAKHKRITEFLEGFEKDPAQLSNFLRVLSFPVGHVLGQTDFVTWDEMKRTAFDNKALVQIADQAREWRGDRTPDTPMYWAYEIVAISLESAAANDPIAAECEQLTDGIIKKAIQDFPIPNRKPTSEVNRNIRQPLTANEKINEKKTQEIKKEEKFKIEKGSLLDTIVKSDDMYAEMGALAVETLKKFAEGDGAPQSTKDNWNTIRNWLEIDVGAELGPDEHHRINKAYKAYMAIGKAPSFKLQPVFDAASEQYNEEGYDYRPDQPPAKVLRTFSRMLATDEEIKLKLDFDVEEEEKRLSSVFNNVPKKKQKMKTSFLKRKLLVAWGVLSVIWIGFGWVQEGEKLSPLLSGINISHVTVATETSYFDDKRSWLQEKSPTGKYEHKNYLKLPVIKLEPDGNVIVKARKYFPSFDDKTNAEFSEYLWAIVDQKAGTVRANEKSHLIERAKEVGMIVTLPPVGVLVLGFLIGGVLRKYPPNQLSPYTKKTIAIALIWIIVVGTWTHFFGEDFFYEYSEKDYMVQFIFFPPIIIIIAAMLWRWATRTPNEKEG